MHHLYQWFLKLGTETFKFNNHNWEPNINLLFFFFWWVRILMKIAAICYCSFFSKGHFSEIFKSKTGGSPLVIQWLGPRAFTAVFWIQSLTGYLRFHKLQCCQKLRKKNIERKMNDLALWNIYHKIQRYLLVLLQKTEVSLQHKPWKPSTETWIHVNFRWGQNDEL